LLFQPLHTPYEENRFAPQFDGLRHCGTPTLFLRGRIESPPTAVSPPNQPSIPSSRVELMNLVKSITRCVDLGQVAWLIMAMSFVGTPWLSGQERIRLVDAKEGAAPSDAIVLFDGKSTDAFLGVDGNACTWPVEDGILSVGKRFIVSKLHFRDAQIHAEFSVPTKAAGNSGLYLHGHYEMQISNTFGSTEPSKEVIGSLYRYELPLVNAGRPADHWQTYDVIYRAPRYRDGKISEPGTITAILNGVLVQNHVSFTEPRSPYTPYVYQSTPYTKRILESLKQTDAGPLYLQDHQSPVRYRSVWIRPLDDKASEFK
jgi:hypothetical protein